jgi:hypothetical protein
MSQLKIYCARAMSGRVKSEVLAEAQAANAYLRYSGIEPLDPVTQEGIEAVPEVIAAPEGQLREFWQRDKEMIREAHVVFDFSPHMKSEGVAHEVAYARYLLWKPVVRVYAHENDVPTVSVARLEDDYLAPNLYQAVLYAKTFFGTRRQRIIWRLRLLKRCLWKFLVYQAGEWK